MRASNSKITSFFKPKPKEDKSSSSSSSSSSNSPGEKEVSSSWDTVKPALVSVPVQVEVLVPQSPPQSQSVHESAPISHIISKGVQVEECGRVGDDSSAIDASANDDDNDGIELDIQQSAESIDDRKPDDNLPVEAVSTSIDAVAKTAGHVKIDIAKPLDETTPPSDDATRPPSLAGSLIAVEDSAAVTVSISSTASEDDNSNQQEMSVTNTEEGFNVAAATATTEIKEKDESDDDFLIANVPKRRLKRNQPPSVATLELKTAKEDFTKEAKSIQKLIDAAKKRKNRLEGYENLSKKIKRLDSIATDAPSGLTEDALEKHGLDKELLNDAHEEADFYISLLQDTPATHRHSVPTVPLHWPHGSSDDTSTFQVANMFMTSSSLADFVSFRSFYDWVSLFWQAPSDFLQVIWQQAPISIIDSPVFVLEVRRVAEYLNWPQIPSEAILDFLETAGVPRKLLDHDQNGDFDLASYLKQDIEESDEKHQDTKFDEKTLRLSCFLRLLRELVPCVRFNYDTITQYLVILSVLSMNRDSGIYANDLFDTLAVLVDMARDEDWSMIAKTWTTKLCGILGKHLCSDQAIIFFDGCMQKYQCSRLCAWSKGTSMGILMAIGPAGQDGNDLNVELDLSVEPVEVLRSINNILSTYPLFSTKTSSYKITYRALNFIRYQLYREVILKSTEAKSLSCQIVKKLTALHNRIDDRMALFIDRSLVKDELLRLATSVDLIIAPVASRKGF